MCGIKKAKGNIIIVMDSDGSHNPIFLNPMVALLDKYDIVLGSRYVKGGISDYGIKRKIISLIFRDIAILLFQPHVKDVLSGYVVAKKEVYDNLKLNPMGYKFVLEVLITAKNIYHATEYPVHFYERKAGKSKADFNQGLQTLWFMAKLFKEKYL
jgi:dolichol-phosphate mannosyltransferase